MGGFTAQVFALFVILAPGGVFFLGFHSAGRTTRLELQRGPTLDIALFVIAASVLHILVGLPWLFVADAAASCAVTDSALSALAPPAARQAMADRCTGRTMLLLAAGYFLTVVACAWLAGRRAAAAVASAPRLFGGLYGPYHDPPTIPGAEPVIIANIMTDVQHEGRVLMYEGKLTEISLNANKTINYVCLTSVQRFYLTLDKGSTRTSRRDRFRPVDRTELPASRLLVPGNQIKNILTRTHPLAVAEPAPPHPWHGLPRLLVVAGVLAAAVMLLERLGR